jgi:hypothetical protein
MQAAKATLVSYTLVTLLKSLKNWYSSRPGAGVHLFSSEFS